LSSHAGGRRLETGFRRAAVGAVHHQAFRAAPGSARYIARVNATAQAGPLSAAAGLAAEGRFRDAIELLTAANRLHRDPDVERQLVLLRRDAFAEVEHEPGGAWPPDVEDPFPGETGLIELAAGAIGRNDTISGTVVHHGAVLVRGLFSAPMTQTIVDALLAAFEAMDRSMAGSPVEDTAPHFVPLELHERFPNRYRGPRRRAENTKVLVAESPEVTFLLFDAFDRVGLRDVFTRHFGSTPVLTENKWTIRHMPNKSFSAWHQEASVFRSDERRLNASNQSHQEASVLRSDELRALNVWIALKRCGPGTDAPGLDVVPRHEDRLYPTVPKRWILTKETFKEAVGDAPVVMPIYEPGDAIFFDDRTLHRTHCEPSMDGVRYSVESWVFAPSGVPRHNGVMVF
jgi:hypothetical protein